jgi:hypothetical protein
MADVCDGKHTREFVHTERYGRMWGRMGESGKTELRDLRELSAGLEGEMGGFERDPLNKYIKGIFSLS